MPWKPLAPFSGFNRWGPKPIYKMGGLLREKKHRRNTHETRTETQYPGAPTGKKNPRNPGLKKPPTGGIKPRTKEVGTRGNPHTQCVGRDSPGKKKNKKGGRRKTPTPHTHQHNNNHPRGGNLLKEKPLKKQASLWKKKTFPPRGGLYNKERETPFSRKAWLRAQNITTLGNHRRGF